MFRPQGNEKRWFPAPTWLNGFRKKEDWTTRTIRSWDVEYLRKKLKTVAGTSIVGYPLVLSIQQGEFHRNTINRSGNPELLETTKERNDRTINSQSPRDSPSREGNISRKKQRQSPITFWFRSIPPSMFHF